MGRYTRIISAPKREWDGFIRDLVKEDGYGKERTYHGITTRERAEEVRKGMKLAGRHNGVSVKAYWHECEGCEAGGPDCRYHVEFSAYSPQAAKAFMERKSRYAGR